MLQYGGITLIILLTCSIFLVTIVIERFLYYKKEAINTNVFLDDLSKLLKSQDIQSALDLCGKNQGFATRVVQEGIKRHDRNSAAIEDAMKVAILEENVRMERFVPIIGTIAVISPFIGLFGTVLGIIRSFSDIAIAKSAGPEVVSKGVAEALVATAAGLLVAIIAVICYNYFKIRIKQINTELSVMAAKIMELLREVKMMG